MLSEMLLCKLLFPLGLLCPFSICIEVSFPSGLFFLSLVMLCVESHIHTPGLSDSSGRFARSRNPTHTVWNNREAPAQPALPDFCLFSWHLSFSPKATGEGEKAKNALTPFKVMFLVNSLQQFPFSVYKLLWLLLLPLNIP